MPEFRFDPPLTLKGNIVVRNLDDAVHFMSGYRNARRPGLQTSVTGETEALTTAGVASGLAFTNSDNGDDERP